MGLCDSSLHVLKESMFLPAYTFREKLRSDKPIRRGSVVADYAESLSSSARVLKRLTEEQRVYADKIRSLLHSLDSPGAGISKESESQPSVLGLEKFVQFLRSIENAYAWGTDIPVILLHAFENDAFRSGQSAQVERYEMQPWSLLIRTMFHQAPGLNADSTRSLEGRRFYVSWAYCKIIAGNNSWTINMEQSGSGYALTGVFHSELSQKPQVDVFFGYSSVSDFNQLTFPMEEPAFEKAVYSEIRSKMRTNFEGRRYISRADLLPFCEPGFVRMSFQVFDTGGKLASIAERTAAEAPRLHAACRYSRVSMTFLVALLNAGFHDKNLPTEETLEVRADYLNHQAHDSDDFFANLASFFPISLGADHGFLDLSRESIVPIQFDWRNHVIGRGGFGEVFKVFIDPTLHTLSTVTRTTPPF